MELVKLREIKEADWDFLVKIRNEPEVREASINTSYFTKEEYIKYITNQLKQSENNRHWILMFENEMIGHTKIINQQFGYIIKKEYRNRGLAKEVMRLVFEESKKLGIKKIYYITKVTQPISLWVSIKNGFQMMGIIRDENSQPYAYKLEKNL